MNSVAIATKSSLKIEAVKDVCNSYFSKSGSVHIDYISHGCDSEINEQPFTLEETLLGAQNRLKNLKSILLQDCYEYFICVSIENGIVKVGDIYIDLAIVIIENKAGKQFISTSSGMTFDEEFVEEARHRGFYSNTVGSVISERFHCDSTDPHNYLSFEIVNRSKLLKQALEISVGQMLRYNSENNHNITDIIDNTLNSYKDDNILRNITSDWYTKSEHIDDVLSNEKIEKLLNMPLVISVDENLLTRNEEI